LFGALMLVGGFAAFRLKWLGLAQAGAVAGVLIGLYAVVGVLLVGLLFLLPLSYSALAIFRGRDQFTRPA